MVETQAPPAIEGFRGRLLAPGDAGYDDARFGWNHGFDKRPALIARCTGVADVIAGVNHARENGMLLAVRGGGHSVPGHSTCDDGLLLDLTPMHGVHVDAKARRAHVQPGVLLGLLDRETQAYGLAVPGGQVSDTGVAGLTLGGGIGWLMRKHGLSCDNLVSAQVVTAKGEVVTASEDENAELFWGLRGGGGNFGVVTSFEFQLHPLGLIFGGAALYPQEQAAEVLRLYRDVTEAGPPDELTMYAIFLTGPPLPFLPEEYHGAPLIALAACWSGELDEGARALAPFRELGPIVDLFQPMPYTALQSMFDASAPRDRAYYIKGQTTGKLDDEALSVLLERAQAMPRPFSELHVGGLGGAVSRVPEDATAYSPRDGEHTLIFISGWYDQEGEDAAVSWVRGTADATDPFATGVYVNFLEDEGDERIRFAYGDKFQRLVELKRTWDPDNLFCLNQNIKP
jgi:FAD/FMN-containing dehydrogenase